MKVLLLVLSLLAALAVAIFAEQNYQPLNVAFLGWNRTTTLPVVVFFSAVLGAACAGILSGVSQLRWRRRVRQLEADVARRTAASSPGSAAAAQAARGAEASPQARDEGED